MRKILGLALALTLTLTEIQLAGAETIEIPVGQQGSERESTPRPPTGMLKSRVEAEFGTPQKITGPVGNPPISQWQYPEYTVYFEYDHVIHSVLTHHPHQ